MVLIMMDTVYTKIPNDDDLKINTIAIGYGLPEIKSCLQAGNLTIMNTKHFNWLQKKMWKIFFGFDIKDVKEN
jgi:hypothetical protein